MDTSHESPPADGFPGPLTAERLQRAREQVAAIREAIRQRGSLFDMSYAALAEQAGTTMWTIDERFYNGARAMGLDFVMHPGRDPLP